MDLLDKQTWLEEHGKLVIGDRGAFYSGMWAAHGRGRSYVTTEATPVETIFDMVKEALRRRSK